VSAPRRWGKRAGKLLLLLLLAELLFFFYVGLRLRRQLEGEREILGARPALAPTADLSA
jgi:hypothetical protein